jgi:hypothetical protein
MNQQNIDELLVLKNNTRSQKIGSELAELYQRYSEGEVIIQNQDDLVSILPDKRIIIDFVAKDNAEALLYQLQTMGLTNASSFGEVVSGSFPISQLGALESIEGLNFARPSYAITNVGATTSQADKSMGADIARNDFGVDGSGVTIGVLSDSYNNLNGARTDISTGDIPGVGNPLGNTTPVNVLADLSVGGRDEGRAMAQLVHDIAPKADLAFHTAFTGQAGFANGIIALANAGAEVIVDDVSYFDEPFFQDGIIAQAVDQVVAQGVSYFSSAGNSATKSYESAFRPTAASGDYSFHDFDPGAG